MPFKSNRCWINCQSICQFQNLQCYSTFSKWMVWLNSSIDRISFDLTAKENLCQERKLIFDKKKNILSSCSWRFSYQSLAILRNGKLWKTTEPQTRNPRIEFPLFISHYYHFWNFMLRRKNDMHGRMMLGQFESYVTHFVISVPFSNMFWLKLRTFQQCQLKRRDKT